MTAGTPVQKNPILLTVMDEYHYYGAPMISSPKDVVLAKVRTHPDVPPQEYAYRDGKVFIFGRFLDAVVADDTIYSKSGELLNEKRLQELLHQSWFAAEDAALFFEVIPEPYEVRDLFLDDWVIVHKDFEARIPRSYSSKEAALVAASKLWDAPLPATSGCFEYKGQKLQVITNLNLDAVGEAPAMDWLTPIPAPEFARRFFKRDLDGFTPGYARLDQHYYDRLQGMLRQWDALEEKYLGIGHAGLDKLCVDSLSKVDFSRLPGRDRSLVENPDAVISLYRGALPQLLCLTDEQIFYARDAYIEWAGPFDEDENTDPLKSMFPLFMLRLLGMQIGLYNDEPYKSLPWFDAALVAGADPLKAKEFAINCQRYGASLARIRNQVARGMAHIEQDSPRVDMVGKEPRTVMEQCRSLSVKPTVVTQTLEDFSNNGQIDIGTTTVDVAGPFLKDPDEAEMTTLGSTVVKLIRVGLGASSG